MIVAIIIASIPISTSAQEQTVGLHIYDSSSYDGYTLFGPMSSTTTYLIDNYGRLINSWEGTYRPRLSVYLCENGNLLRTIGVTGSGGETGGGFQEVDWDGNIVWEYDYYGDHHLQHHDIEPLPNGNVLVLAWEHKSRTEAIEAGRDPTFLDGDTLSPEHIIEVARNDATGHDIVWEWHLWDHLIQDFDTTKTNHGIVADHPELMDINFAKRGNADWNHGNSVAYSQELDQIVISSRALDEIWVIDHSTTTAEAAGHTGGNNGMGGDILYRWGNPQSYRAGDESDKVYFGQHDANWVPSGYPGEGNILVFSNGKNRPGSKYSTIEEIIPPVDGYGTYPQPSPGIPHGPAGVTWNYTADPPTDFYSTNISGCQRMPNGNTLICSGSNGIFFEVNPAGDIIWKYINPVNATGPILQGETPGANNVFKCRRYSADFPGLQGRDLTPKGQLEIYPIKISGTEHNPLEPSSSDSVIVTAIIKGNTPITEARLFYLTGDGLDSISIYDDGIHGDSLSGDGIYGGALPPQPTGESVRYYIYVKDESGATVNDPPLAGEIVYSYSVSPAGFICGDANGTPPVNILDITYLITFLYKGGSAPVPYECVGDVNGNSAINILDITYLITFLYKGGPPPVTDCCNPVWK